MVVGSSMKKTFPLQVTGKPNERVAEGVRRDIRRYVKRERAKALPEGFTVWEFDCRIGTTTEAAEAKALSELGATVDTLARAGAPAVYVEILARAGHRVPPRDPGAPATA